MPESARYARVPRGFRRASKVRDAHALFAQNRSISLACAMRIEHTEQKALYLIAVMPIAYNLRIHDGSRTLQRALRIVAARKGMSVHDFLLCTIYAALNRELADVSLLWQPITFEDLRKQRRATQEQRSVAARIAANARWHPELHLAESRSSERVAGNEEPVSPPPRPRPAVRCPVSADHAAERREDGRVWCRDCGKLYLLANQ